MSGMGDLKSYYSFVKALCITLFKHHLLLCGVAENNHSLSITLDGAPKHPLL
jgi:hypothetical protein